MSQGKILEILITQIEKTLRAFDYIEVKNNVKLLDKDNVLRQIDVLIEVDMGERLEKLRIIVECKDSKASKRKVGLDKVGSFINLLDSLNIGRGIMVSSKGFQDGAIKKAKGSGGKVRLCTLDNVDSSQILNWLNMPIYRFGYSIDASHLQYELDITSQIKVDSPEYILNASIFRGDKFISSFDNFISNNLKSNKDQIKKHLIQEALKLRKLDSFEQSGNIILGINFTDSYFLFYNQNKIELLGLRIIITAKLIKQESETVEIMHYKELHSLSVTAETLVADFKDSIMQIVSNPKTGDNKFFIITKEKHPEVIEIFDLGIIKD